jgi:UDP-N-acetylglucosamine 2-epimerase
MFSIAEGRMNDEATLRENKVSKGCKIMVVGSTVTDVLAVNEPACKTSKSNDTVEASSSKEPLCKQKVCLFQWQLLVFLICFSII